MATIEEIRQEFAETQQAIDAVKADNNALRGEKERVDDIHMKGVVDFPTTKERLDVIRANVATMRAYKEDLIALADKVDNVEKGIVSIYEMEARFEAYLKAIYRLNEAERFDEAFPLLDDMSKLVDANEYGETLSVQAKMREIIAWTRAALYVRQAETRIAKDLAPMEEETLNQFGQIVQALPLGIHLQESKDALNDRILGYRCLNQVQFVKANGFNYDNLLASMNLLGEISELLPNATELTGQRYEVLRIQTTEQYNFLAIDAFDVRRVYEDAAVYFGLRDSFIKEEITHVDYREAVDEHDFKLRFYIAEAKRMSDEEFGIAVAAYADSIQNEDEFEFEVLLTYLTMEEIQGEKLARLYDAIDRLDFEKKVILLGRALPVGLPVDRQQAVLDRILSVKKKRLDLEKCAKELRNCRDLIDETLQKPVKSFLSDLLRSPRAHKVAVKSTSVDLHVLYGEEEDAIRAPWGKPAKKRIVRPWDLSGKFAYIFFLIFFLSALFGLAFALIIALYRQEPACPYVLLAPLMAELVLVHCLVIARHGRDERGSAIARRALGADALWKSALSLVYFLLPGELSAIRFMAYTLIIFAAIEGLWGFFFLKDRRKGITALIYVPLLLCEIASLVFLILGLMNGTI